MEASCVCLGNTVLNNERLEAPSLLSRSDILKSCIFETVHQFLYFSAAWDPSKLYASHHSGKLHSCQRKQVTEEPHYHHHPHLYSNCSSST